MLGSFGGAKTAASAISLFRIDHFIIHVDSLSAYIQGIHETQNEATVRSGFHQDFAMLVLQDNALEKVTVDEWLPQIETLKAQNPDMWEAETRYTIELVDVAGYAAVAKLDVHKGAIHFSTDYMLLYKFKEGWRIVSKVFSIPS